MVSPLHADGPKSLPLLREAIAHWDGTDALLASLAREYPPVADDGDSQDAFASLCSAIIHQQVSLAAGRTIAGRFLEAVGGHVTPQAVEKAGFDTLRSAGLSNAKATYVLDLAAHAASGALDNLGPQSDAEVIEQLTKVKGIGTWSAKMFLLFHLQRPDVCPWEDLGVRLAVAQFYGSTEKDAARLLQDDLSQRWAPYNSLAAMVLWNARRAVADA